MNILALDIGGTHVKLSSQRHPEIIRIPSGPKMTPEKMLAAIDEQIQQQAAKGTPQQRASWAYDRVSIGFPGPVVHDHPLREPFNLGKGWVKFRWQHAFGDKPVRMLNDAAMQALGSYNGGRMLFLGLGTGLGSAMVVDGLVQAMELAHLPWKKGKTYEEFLGLQALEHDGKKKWRKHTRQVIDDLSAALEVEYVVLGGGNAKLMTDLPPHVTLGSNDNAMKGAFLLWQKKATRIA